jgi:hypothetical protein
LCRFTRISSAAVGLEPSFVWSGLLITRLAAPPITARNERPEDTMMVRADIDRTWQIDGCRVSLMTEGVHSYSPILMLIEI